MNTKAATSPRTEDALPEGHRGKVDSRTQLGNGAMGETESGDSANGMSGTGERADVAATSQLLCHGDKPVHHVQ